MWCIAPKEDARFVAAMEDVLEVYERPFDAKRPLVCLDEGAKQILSEVRKPLPMKSTSAPASVMRYDNEYERHGTCALFMLSQPLTGIREVLVRDRRTALDYAQVIRHLCDEVHPEAEVIVLVQDNLNTHGSWSLYETFVPQEAQRLTARIEHRVALHPETRLVAQHGRDRTECVGAPMFARTHGESPKSGTTHPHLATDTQLR